MVIQTVCLRLCKFFKSSIYSSPSLSPPFFSFINNDNNNNTHMEKDTGSEEFHEKDS